MLALAKPSPEPTLLTKDNARFVLTLLDPRGRCNRQGLLVLAVALLVIQFVAGVLLSIAGFGLDTPVGLIVSALFLWIGFAASAKRLHDCNLSAWWFVATIAAWMVGTLTLCIALTIGLGPESMDEGAFGFWIALLTMMLAVVGAMVWLHLQKGDEGTNRFGPAPRESGFAMPIATSESLVPAMNGLLA